ncbi:MAG: hypothetical protein ACLUKN_01890 [Bacilli bacterium]
MARIISLDLTIAQSQGWGYWKGMEVKGDHALVGLYPKNGRLEDGGVARANKMLWALGNYSLFIRPGFKRVDLAGADDVSNVLGSAFISPDGKRIVAVFVNSSSTLVPRTYLCHQIAKRKLQKYPHLRQTNAATCRISEFRPVQICLFSRSITTFVYD